VGGKGSNLRGKKWAAWAGFKKKADKTEESTGIGLFSRKSQPVQSRVSTVRMVMAVGGVQEKKF